MQVIVTGRHLELEPSVKDTIAARLEEMTARTRLTSARVIIDMEKVSLFSAEVLLHGKNTDIEAKATTHSLDLAIEEVLAKTAKQVEKHLSRTQDHHRESLAQSELKTVEKEEEA